MVPGGRDRFVDLLRGGSIVAVVVGHWLVADLGWSLEPGPRGRLTLVSSLAEVPALWPATWLAVVIPVFFFVGGYANLRSWAGTRRRGEGYASFVDRRVQRVLAPTALYLGVVGSVGLAADIVGGVGLRAMGGVLLQPLWFLGVYLVITALVPVTLRAHERFGVAAPAVLVAVVIGLDLARYAAGVPAAGYANVLVVWLLMHQLGYLYADGTLSGTPDDWRRPAELAVGGLVAATALVAWGPYPATMVGVPGGEGGNMHPPTLAMTMLGLAQIGLLLVVRAPLLRWLERPRVWSAVVAVNLTVVSIYLWHQAALTLAARVVLPWGLGEPTPGGIAWWVDRAFWLVLPGLVLAGIVAVVGWAERLDPPRPIPAGPGTAAAAALAVALVMVGYLSLSGSSATEPMDPGQSLGPVTASPALGVGALLLAWLVLTAARSARPRPLRPEAGTAPRLSR